MEILDLYDNRKRKTGKTLIREKGEPKTGEYKLSVHLWVINENGEFLIQQRSTNRKVNPSKWAFTGGAVMSGEASEEGAIREAKEELGIDLTLDDLELLITFKREHDFVDVWLVRTNIKIGDVKIQIEEVSEVKWASLEEIENLINEDKFVPALSLYFHLFKKLLYKH